MWLDGNERIEMEEYQGRDLDSLHVPLVIVKGTTRVYYNHRTEYREMLVSLSKMPTVQTPRPPIMCYRRLNVFYRSRSLAHRSNSLSINC